MNFFLTFPPGLVVIGAATPLVHVMIAPSPAAYLSLIITVSLRMRHKGRRLVRDNAGK